MIQRRGIGSQAKGMHLRHLMSLAAGLALSQGAGLSAVQASTAAKLLADKLHPVSTLSAQAIVPRWQNARKKRSSWLRKMARASQARSRARFATCTVSHRNPKTRTDSPIARLLEDGLAHLLGDVAGLDPLTRRAILGRARR